MLRGLLTTGLSDQCAARRFGALCDKIGHDGEHNLMDEFAILARRFSLVILALMLQERAEAKRPRLGRSSADPANTSLLEANLCPQSIAVQR